MGSWRSALAAVMLVALAMSGAAGSELLPASGAVADWSRPGEARAFTTGNLWEYIDGAADLFLAYGFTRLEAGQYLRGGDAERSITIDVYDMGAPINAFGVYANEKGDEAKPLAAGTQGYEAGELLAFWKGRYYVKLALMDSRDTEAARKLAAAAAAGLEGDGELPAELKRLPTAGRLAGSEKYVRQDALGHKGLSKAVSADYRLGGRVMTLYVSDLSNAAQAGQAWQKLHEFERQSGKALEKVGRLGEAAFAARDPGYGETVVARQGQFVIIGVSETAKRGLIAKLVREAVGKLNVPGVSAKD